MTAESESLAFSYDASDDRFTYVGAPGLRKHESGAVQVRRIPDVYSQQIPSAVMKLVTDTSAGARVRFRTSANRIELHFSAHQIAAEGAERPLTGMQLLRGDMVRTYSGLQPRANLNPISRAVLYDPPHPAVAVFDELGNEDGEVDILLPNGAVVDLFHIRANAEIFASAADVQPRWVHHGSSISHCSTTLEPLASWPVRAAQELGLSLCNLGFAGNAMLDPFVARTIRDLPAEIITLKIGINLVNSDAMSLRSFGPALHGFLDTIREGQPTTPILLISPIACSAVENLPGPTIVDLENGSTTVVPIDEIRGATALTLSRIRTAMEEIAHTRSETDPWLSYLDGRSLFSEHDESNGHLFDGLHPDDEGNQLMGGRFVEIIRRLALIKP